jgi:predicted RNA-binding protein with PIN domain
VAHLVIDGYNFINRSRSGSIHGDTNLDALRRTFLDRLFRYKKEKGAKITVVFDAYNSVSLGRQREGYKGIDVVYSNQNETADEVIIGWIRQKRAGMVIVSSDRAIIDEAKTHGVPFLTSMRLAEMMAEIGAHTSEQGKEEDAEEAYQGKRKGNPRKLPKKLRRVTKAIDKL